MRRCLHYMSTKITGFHDLTFEYYSFCKNKDPSLKKDSQIMATYVSTSLIIRAMLILLNEKKYFFLFSKWALLELFQTSFILNYVSGYSLHHFRSSDNES